MSRTSGRKDKGSFPSHEKHHISVSIYLKFPGLEDENLWLCINYFNNMPQKQKNTLFYPWC